ncbi:hypothetical protein [uncultured Methylobacterium sp.]|jgi:phage protein D|uniref:phage late control D family protein n=1 Tax=uncultured Methylobacterium sp. TaxID=157278 RepID=UPI002606373A|nr:hypothetical protein [uncultured Methylobacterium sp.]
MPAGFTPVYKVLKEGADITSNFNSRTLQIKVELKGGNGNSDTCEITIDDRDWRVEAVEVGVKIEIFLGYKEVGYAQMGVFEVTTVDYEINPRQIRITGTGVSFTTSLKSPQIKNFQDKTLGDVLKDFAKQGGVEAIISPDLAKEKVPFLNQVSSPLHFIHELERRYGALAKFENNKLIFVPRDEGETASGLGTMVLLLRPYNITKGFVRHTTRGEYSGVKVGWYDENHRKHYVEEKNNSAPTDEEGKEQNEPFLSGRLGRSEAEARSIAKSQLAMLRRSTGDLHVTLSKGDPWIRDQMRTLMKGFRDKIDGSYVNEVVTHTYVKDGGINTDIVAKPPGTGADYSSLDEGNFYKLGSGGVVGDVGPQLPDGSPIGAAPEQPPLPADPDTPSTPAPVEPPVDV